jgi:formate/nitrite transporter
MRVSELMSRDVVTIGDTATCHEALEQMCRRKVRHLPVLDGAGALVGIVTDRDLRHWRFTQAIALGVLCNTLVCLAVWLTLSARTTADRILAIVPPISAFVAAGFEHSVANMYFVPFGLLLTEFDPGFAGSAGASGHPVHSLTWGRFLSRNLLPVTIGNVIGGAVLVGLVYWFVYLRPQSPPVVSGAGIHR